MPQNMTAHSYLQHMTCAVPFFRTTFTLTFFVNGSYALWRKCMELSRRLQGRLHDIDMSLAAHAARKPQSSPNEPSTYTAASHQLLELVSRYVRLFNLLTYASFTRSHRPILTPRGMRRLVERGLMTPQERQILIDAEIPATQRHNAVLLWIMRTFVEGREAGHFLGGAGFEEQWLEKIHVTRAQYGGIGDELQGRMPLAYAHIVQVLVDIILWMYPFMAFSVGMSWFLTVLGTGLLTVSYQGLFDLAKQFLDPYDNESYGKGEDPLVVDTLIAETNAGSVRWLNGLDQYPIAGQRIKEGELSDYLLPLRGYSVEELAQMEEEKLQKERELQEKRAREEEERRKMAQEEKRLKDAAEALIPGLWQEGMTTFPSDLAGATIQVSHSQQFSELTQRMDKPPVSLGAITSITNVLDILPSLQVCDDVVDELIPEETAPAEPEVVCLDAAEELDELEPLMFGGEALDSAYFDEINGDEEGIVNGDQTYVHAFDAFDPYGDLPWHDEVGPDGQEIRLSQILADEIWEEELEAAREKEPRIRTYAEFAKKASDILDSKNNELIETEEILMEAPGSQSSATPVKEAGEYPTKYDQTRLDGLSQLWGLPPGELSDLPGYEEPPVQPGEGALAGISQLWGGSIEAGNAVAPLPEELLDSFGSISSLWGDDDESGDFGPGSSTGTRTVREALSTGSRRVGSGTRRVKGESSTSSSRTRRTKPESESVSSFLGDAREMRLSQFLADEVWGEEDARLPTEPSTRDDYSRQVREILQAEKEELLETAAILSAPPGADSVVVADREERPTLPLQANATSAAAAATSPVVSGGGTGGGDIDFDSYMEAVKLEEERLETQAILNAPPAAESVDVPEPGGTLSLANFTAAVAGDPRAQGGGGDDDLAVLEMDVAEEPVEGAGTRSVRGGTQSVASSGAVEPLDVLGGSAVAPPTDMEEESSPLDRSLSEDADKSDEAVAGDGADL